MAFHYLTKMDLHISRSCPTQNYPLKKCTILINMTHNIYVHEDCLPHFFTATVYSLKTKSLPPIPKEFLFPLGQFIFFTMKFHKFSSLKISSPS